MEYNVLRIKDYVSTSATWRWSDSIWSALWERLADNRPRTRSNKDWRSIASPGRAWTCPNWRA